MKNLTFLFIFLFSTIIVVGQSNPVVVDQFKWDDPVIFKLSPPHITNYGEHSDSLSQVYDGYEFYVSNGKYYAISNLANYYHWFVNEYWWKFTDPQLYEYYFLSGNNYEMMKYIYCGGNYWGLYYPVDLAIQLEEERITQLERRMDIKYTTDHDALLNDMKADLELGRKTRVASNSKLESLPAEGHKTNSNQNTHTIKGDNNLIETHVIKREKKTIEPVDLESGKKIRVESLPAEERKTNSNQNTHTIERNNNPIETHVIKREEKTIEPVRYVEPPKKQTTKNYRK